MWPTYEVRVALLKCQFETPVVTELNISVSPAPVFVTDAIVPPNLAAHTVDLLK